MHRNRRARSYWLLGASFAVGLIFIGDAWALAPPVVASRLRVELTRVVDRPSPADLAFPTVGMAFAPGNDDRMYFLEKGNGSLTSSRIRVLENGVYSTFLQLSGEVDARNENGLLGMAFHPGYSDPASPGYRKLYTYHSTPAAATPDFTTIFAADHDNVITEWQVDANNPLVVDPTSRREVLREAHPDYEHNAGTITFGPDGYLYGAFGTPYDDTAMALRAQNNSDLLGTVIRIDPLAPTSTPSSANPISANGKYRIPADNPFVADSSALSEIYAYGFRNPYRFSVDPVSGKLFVGDVGQNTTEEVHVVEPGGNYGWPFLQGNDPGVVPMPDPAPSLAAPIAAYDHANGTAIVGGYVYRGPLQALQGKYIFGDFSSNFFGFQASGKLFISDVFDAAGNLKDPSEIRVEEILTEPVTCAASINPGCGLDTVQFSFAQDSLGNLYSLGVSASQVIVYKITGAYYLAVGDFNETGTVSAADYTVWRDALGQLVPNGQSADANGDGVVNFDDYLIWRANFGQTAGQGTVVQPPVPEPSSLLIVLCLGSGLLSATRCQRCRLAT
jgi:glucose/arabinose dehydrogenase